MLAIAFAPMSVTTFVLNILIVFLIVFVVFSLVQILASLDNDRPTLEDRLLYICCQINAPLEEIQERVKEVDEKYFKKYKKD